jgi:hypothetical protein
MQIILKAGLFWRKEFLYCRNANGVCNWLWNLGSVCLSTYTVRGKWGVDLVVQRQAAGVVSRFRLRLRLAVKRKSSILDSINNLISPYRSKTNL